MYRYKILSILIACLCLLTLSCADSPKSTDSKQKPVVVKLSMIQTRNHRLLEYLASVQSVVMLPSFHLHFRQGKSTVMITWLS